MGDEVKEFKRTEEEEAVLSQFSAKLRKLRVERGYSQEEMAHLAGFSRSYYTEVETGRRNISLLNFHKILKALQVGADDLFDFTERE